MGRGLFSLLVQNRQSSQRVNFYCLTFSFFASMFSYITAFGAVTGVVSSFLPYFSSVLISTYFSFCSPPASLVILNLKIYQLTFSFVLPLPHCDHLSLRATPCDSGSAIFLLTCLVLFRF